MQEGEVVFWTHLVKIREVDANLSFTSLLFFTMTGLANNLEYLTSVIDYAPRCLSILSLTAFALSGPKFLLLCLIVLKFGSTFSS